ncbi:MAG: hypothetical protein LLF97_07515, partial [Planctomycetaceae bacterium]|nr:hypothetical protein [Planctomycetaceae bacterium]
LAALLWVSMGAQQRTPNFIVNTPDPAFAKQVAQAAEQYRRDLAVAWTGQAMPDWSRPCQMTVQIGGGAGGATTFVFERGEVFNWQMTIQGSRERILDSVLPHEITHMVFASHFRRPLPRWADEGGATSVEHCSELNKHRTMLRQFLTTGRGIAFDQMFAMTEYPSDIMPLYAQGYSLANFLIQTGGRRTFVDFLGDGLESEDWPSAVQRHYGIQNLAALQNTWLAWVRQGSPNLPPHETKPAEQGPMLAAATASQRPRPAPNLIYHLHDRQPQAVPLAAMVPVQLASAQSTTPRSQPVATADALASTIELRPAQNARWIDPSPKSSASETTPNAVPTASVAATSPSGWRLSGQPAAADSSTTTQVAHPQPLEQPRQTILR